MDEPREHAVAAAGRVPMLQRIDSVPQLSDEELERELTIAAGARTTSRQHVFDLLFDELHRRRRAQ